MISGFSLNAPIVANKIKDKIHRLAEKLADKELEIIFFMPTALVSLQTKKRKIIFDDESCLLSYMQRINFGLSEISTKQGKLANFYPDLFTSEVVAELNNLTHDIVLFQELALDHLTDNSLTALFELSAQAHLALFRIASEIYNDGRYKDAAAAFSIVTLVNPTLYDAWISLAHAEYHIKSYDGALIAYAMAAEVRPFTPVPHIFAAHCYEALQELENGIESLNYALQLIDNNIDLREWKEIAEIHKNDLFKKVHRRS